MKRNAKIDKNQNEIVNALRKIGCYVLITSQLKNAFDILVGFRSQLFIIEIKDGEKYESQKRLTDGEMKCKTGFESVGVKYHVVESVEQAINLVTNQKVV